MPIDVTLVPNKPTYAVNEGFRLDLFVHDESTAFNTLSVYISELSYYVSIPLQVTGNMPGWTGTASLDLATGFPRTGIFQINIYAPFYGGPSVYLSVLIVEPLATPPPINTLPIILPFGIALVLIVAGSL